MCKRVTRAYARARVCVQFRCTTSGRMRRGSPRKYQRRWWRVVVIRSGIWESMRSRGEYTLCQLAARNTPEECTPAAAAATLLCERSQPVRSTLRDHPFGRPLITPLRPVPTLRPGRIWCRARHSWYFRKFDALPMSRERRGKRYAREDRAAGRSAVRSIWTAAATPLPPIVRVCAEDRNQADRYMLN